jgi:hypothetical protein
MSLFGSMLSKRRRSISVGLDYQSDMSVDAVQEPVELMLRGILVGGQARTWKGAIVVDDENAAGRQARVKVLQLVLGR